MVIHIAKMVRSILNSGSGRSAGVVQVQNPNRLLVLETESGRQLASAPLAEGESLESPPVPIDEDHVLLVPIGAR